VPFCLTRCGYCDFNAYADLDHLRQPYMGALLAEADLWREEWAGVLFDSIFLGGGTPTMLEVDDLAALLDGLRSRFEVAEDAEVTVEANPDTVDVDSLRVLRDTGYSRLSMGAQSFDAGVLASLERVHQPDAVRRAFAASRTAGYDDVNLDLIYGAQDESLQDWRATLTEAIELGPEHISAYALTVEPNTPLGRQVSAGERPGTDPDLQADMFELACELLAGAGYGHYEVSNWALPGRECRHNLNYWRRGAYLGLGAGAHSHRDERRWWNLRAPEAYLRAVSSAQRPVGGDEELAADQIHMEEFFLRLRTREGIPVDWVGAELSTPFERDGLLERRDDSWVLTERGMFLANELTLALVG
jgi:oxygen-independent coproporphyrinogen-3 oxidase